MEEHLPGASEGRLANSVSAGTSSVVFSGSSFPSVRSPSIVIETILFEVPVDAKQSRIQEPHVVFNTS